MFSKVDNIGAERMYSECPVGDCFRLRNDLYCVGWGVKTLLIHPHGRLFHATGPATQNAQLPSCSLVLGTTNHHEQWNGEQKGGLSH